MTTSFPTPVPTPYGRAEGIGHVGNNEAGANVTYNFYGCGGCGHRRCQPSRHIRSRRPAWLQWILRFCFMVLRDMRQMRRTIRDLTQRVENLESLTSKGVTHAEVDSVVDHRINLWIARYGQRIAESVVRTTASFRPTHFWNRILGGFGALAGALGAFLFVLSKRPATRLPLEAGWAETILINDNGFLLWIMLFGAIGGCIIGAWIGRFFDGRRDAKRLADLNNAAARQAISDLDNSGV